VQFCLGTEHVMVHCALCDVTYLLLVSNYEMVIGQKWEVNV
jgi:hypothetical protein